MQPIWKRFLEADPESDNEDEREDAAIGQLINQIQEI